MNIGRGAVGASSTGGSKAIVNVLRMFGRRHATSVTPVFILGLLCLAKATPGWGQSNQLFIEFTAAQYRVSEINRTVKLPLRLVGSGYVGVPTVNYATHDGTAK